MSIAGSPGEVEAAADAVAGAGGDFADTADSIASHGRAVTAHWSGSASDAAGEAIAVLATRTRVGADVCAQVAPVLGTYAAELRAAQQQYEHASAAADAARALASSAQADQDAASGRAGATRGQAPATASARTATTQALDRAHQAVRAAQVSMADAVARAELANATAAAAVDALTDQLTAMAAMAAASTGVGAGVGATGRAVPGGTAATLVGWPEPWHEAAPPSASTGGEGEPWYEHTWEATREGLDHVAHDVGDFAGSVTGYYGEHPDRMGELLGSAALTGAGLGLVDAGAGAELGGLALDATGIGALAGVPINIAAAGVIATGAALAGGGAVAMSQNLHTMMQERDTSTTEGTSPPRGGSGGAPREDVHPPRETWGNPNSLQSHFENHGADFGATTPEEYAKDASEFLTKARQSGFPTKVGPDGVLRVYDPETNTFGSYNADGTTRTFFRPSSPTYWNRQPGALQ